MKSPRTVVPAGASGESLNVAAFEEVLACNIKDVVADFCLADADIIRFYASNQLHGNMDEMVMSSAELYFKGETLSYAYAADLSLAWGHPPRVVLDMEFAHDAVSVSFKLDLGEHDVGVHISQVHLTPGSNKDFCPRSFAEVLSSARLRPLPTHFRSSYCPAAALH
jgi:hypothetical protein